jgi:hypothetical protein
MPATESNTIFIPTPEALEQQKKDQPIRYYITG